MKISNSTSKKKLRVFEVRIRSREELNAAAIKAMKTLIPSPPELQGVFFHDYETARALFTDKRLELLRLIKKHAPKSISELARIAGRDFKNVHTDVTHFARLDIVKIPKGKHAGKPLEVLYDEINLHATV